MNFDRFEKDFNKWMLEAYNENSVLKKLLDDNFQKDIDELSKHFRSDASAFVIDLQDLTERIFTDGIAKHEKMENVRSSREVLRVLENRKRVRKEQVDIIKRLNSLSPNDFNGISFPSKEDFLEIKRAKVTQVFKLVDFKKDAEETNEKEEEHVNRLTDSEKEKFQSSKNILTKLKNAHEKYEDLIVAYKAMTIIASWYYRMYKETPDVGFQWELTEEEEEKVDRERMMMVGSYAGCLTDEYNIIKAPFRMYDKPVAIENTVQIDKIIEIEVPFVTVKEMPVENIIEKEVIKEVAFKVHTEIATEKQVEVPFTVTNTVAQEILVQKEAPIFFPKEIRTNQLVEIPMIVAKPVQKRTIIEKPVEVIKEIEVPQEFVKPVAVTKLMKPPSFFVAAGFVILFAVIGSIAGFLLRLVLLPPGDEMLIAERDEAVSDMKLARNDADTRIGAAINAQNDAEKARDAAIAEKDSVFAQIATQQNKIDDNDRQIDKMSKRISDLEISKTNNESEITTLKAAKAALESDKARLERQMSDSAGLSKQQLIDLQKELGDKDTEIDNLKEQQKKNILELREEYNEKIDKLVKSHDDVILGKDKDIRERKIAINTLNRAIVNLQAQIEDLTDSSTGASTKLVELRKTLTETEVNLAKAEDDLAQTTRNLDSEKRKHKITQDTLSTTESELTKNKNELALTKDNLSKTSDECEQFKKNFENETNKHNITKDTLTTTESKLLKNKNELALTKEDLTKTSVEREQFKNNYDSETRKHKITKDELKNTEDALDDANNTIDKAKRDIAGKDKEISEKKEEVTVLEKEVDYLKRELDIFGEKDKMLKEEKILLEAAFSTRTKDRAIRIERDINEFLKIYPERRPNFKKALEFIEKAKQKESVGKTDEKTAEEFKLLAEASKGTAYFSPSAEELPGILNEILNRELGLAKSADIVLLIDTTSTMKNDIDTLKAEVAKVAKKIKDICPDVRTAIVCYRDLPTKFGDPGYIYKIMSEFTIKTQRVQDAIKNITLGKGKGNYDMPEAVYEGIMGSLTDLHWSHRAEKKMIILMGDAPPATGKKVYVDKRTGRTVDLQATHKFTISSIKKKLEDMQLELEDDKTIQIFPIIIAED